MKNFWGRQRVVWQGLVILSVAVSSSIEAQSKGGGREKGKGVPSLPAQRTAERTPSRPVTKPTVPQRPTIPERAVNRPSVPQRPSVPERAVSKPSVPQRPSVPERAVSKPSVPPRVSRPQNPAPQRPIERSDLPNRPVDKTKYPSRPSVPERPSLPERPVDRTKMPPRASVPQPPQSPQKALAPDSDFELERNSWMRQRVDSGRHRMRRIQDDRTCHEQVVYHQNHFKRVYLETITVQHNVMINHSHECHDWYRSYRRYGFYGGFYFGYRPILDVTVYFSNPLWSWFYLDVVEDHHYAVWYGSYVHYRPIPVFRYRRVFHPTVEFRNMVIGISDLDYDTQIRFREGMENLTALLGQKLADLTRSSVTLSDNEVVVTHYQVLEDRAVVVEGYVWKQGTRFAFKGFINLWDPQDVMLFVPGNPYGEPSWEELDLLEQMNDRILYLGGAVARD